MKKSNNTKKSVNTKKSTISLNQILVAKIMDDITKTGMSWGFALIPIDQIITKLPYQRPIDELRVNRIVKEFSWEKVDAKCVNYRPDEDKFAIMDGLHTLTAFKTLGKTFLPCKVFIGKTYEEEAMIFAEQNKGVKKISSVDEFRALVEAKDWKAQIIMNCLKTFDVELASQAGYKKCRSVRKLVKIMDTYGVDGLWFVFEVIRDAGWEDDGKAYTESSLNIGFYAYPELLKKNGEVSQTKYKCLLKVLKKYKTSTQYVDKARQMFSVTTTTHPQDAVKKLIERDLETVQVEYQRMMDYQRVYKTRGSVIRVEDVED